MIEPVSLAAVKGQLRLAADETGEDEHLGMLIPAARRAVENRIHRTIVGPSPTIPPDDLPIAILAILMIVTFWYENRDTVELPAGAAQILAPLQYWGA